MASVLWPLGLHGDSPATEGPGSARVAATQAVDTNLVGRTGDIFTTLDHLSNSYVRSRTCWAGDFDLSSVAVYNSVGMELSTNSCCPWERATRRAGTLISPRHVVYANHYPIALGAKFRFVAKNNTVVTRTLYDSIRVGDTDLRLGVLDSNVPANLIHYAKVLPADFARYFPTSLNDIPTLGFNQVEQALVTDIRSLSPSATNATWITFSAPADATRKQFYQDKISGDSGQPAFLIVNGELVLLTVWSGGGPGSGCFITHYTAEINSAMASLGGGYRLTPVDLRGFRTY